MGEDELATVTGEVFSKGGEERVEEKHFARCEL
jgi:hypothetical protein